jgi:hypothetical protein
MFGCCCFSAGIEKPSNGLTASPVSKADFIIFAISLLSLVSCIKDAKILG